MAEVVIMPKLGFNMDEGQLVKWHKQVGETVKKGEVLFEINTDKTTMPVEATEDGTLLKIILEEGAFAEVFTPIAVTGAPGEDPDAALASAGQGQAGGSAPAAAPSAPAAPVDMKSLKLTPKARKLVQDEGIDPASLTQIKGTGFQGGITYKDLKASPLARRVARQMGVDLAAVQGTGAAGKIMKADVEAAAAKAAPASAGSDTRQVASAVPYKGVRRIIGEKLAQSKFTAPHLYFTDAVDTTELAAFRKRLNGTSEVKIAVSDLLTMAACKALKKFPGINVTLKDDQVVTYKSINIGTAVAGDNGLVVPVVKNVQNKSLTDVAAESKDLVARAKEGRLKPEEYSNGTFSISNLGMFGVETFNPIINQPDAGILGVCAVQDELVMDAEGNITKRQFMRISFTFDHRLIDGATAAKFELAIRDLMEHPMQILL